MKIERIKGNTYIIDTGFLYIPFYKKNEKEIILFDSGLSNEFNDLIRLLDQENLSVAGILNSHYHVDHIGNNTKLRERYGCLTAGPEIEAQISKYEKSLKLLYKRQTISENVHFYQDLLCETDVLISDKEEHLQFCGTDFRILQLPGHSMFQIGVVTPDDVCYLGDALVDETVMKDAKLPYVYFLKEDLKTKADLSSLNHSYYILTHRSVHEDISQLIKDNLEFYKTRALAVYEMIETGMTFEQLVKKAVEEFDIIVKNVEKYMMIEEMLESYTDYLREIGKIRYVIREGYLIFEK